MPSSLHEPQLRVSVSRSSGSVVVQLAGELDVATAEIAEGELQAIVRERPPPSRVVLDADQLTFMDAAGLTPLLNAYRLLPPGTLRIRNARPPIVRVLRLLDLAAPLGLDA